MITLGIDLGGTKMSAGLVDESGTIIEKAVVARPADAAGMEREPLELVAALLNPKVVAIGLGAAGMVDHRDGRLVWGPNVAGRDIGFRTLLIERFGLPAVVDNDANLAALAESRFGSARGYDHLLMVTLGTGIGGGILIDGRIYRGSGYAGEVGHMVVDVGGPVCTCGQNGCWETFASGRRLDQLARDRAAADPDGRTARLAGGGPVSGAHLTEAARQGDGAAQDSLAEMGGWLGVGLASLVAVLDPEVVVIGGGASRAGELLLEPTRRSMADSLEGAGFRSLPPVVAAGLGEDAGLVGAALAAAEMADG